MRVLARVLTVVAAVVLVSAGTPFPEVVLADQQRPGTPPPQRSRRAPIQAVVLETPAWTDGGRIPDVHTQAGAETSPALRWSQVPDGTVSFVLVAHDVDAPVGDGTGDVLHWLLWNIPASMTGLPEAVPMAAELPDGTRQISQTGPYYRGPGAMASGTVHHYVFELFALDTMLDVPAVGQSPADTRGAVMAAMAGHVLGKGALVGLFRRSE